MDAPNAPPHAEWATAGSSPAPRVRGAGRAGRGTSRTPRRWQRFVGESRRNCGPGSPLKRLRQPCVSVRIRFPPRAADRINPPRKKCCHQQHSGNAELHRNLEIIVVGVDDVGIGHVITRLVKLVSLPVRAEAGANWHKVPHHPNAGLKHFLAAVHRPPHVGAPPRTGC